tara:strand:- start:211 stop:516 length:306 start_codon:yes stop_codon:yes gene_type:complete
MEQIVIRNNAELLEFIKRKDVTVLQSIEVVEKALEVLCLESEKKTKNKLINEVEEFIKNYCQNDNAERPLFLEKLQLYVTIDGILSHPETKRINDELEEKY